MKRLRVGTVLAAVPLAAGMFLVGGGTAQADDHVHFECQSGLAWISPLTGVPIVDGFRCTGPVGTFTLATIHLESINFTATCPTTMAFPDQNGMVFTSSYNCL